MQKLCLAVAQTNPTVGDFAGNLANTRELMRQAAGERVDLLVFGELSLTGYPLGDLSYRRDVVDASESALRDLIAASAQPDLEKLTVVVGCVTLAPETTKAESGQRSRAIAHNTAIAFRGGKELARYHKRRLPNYDVFDDWRNFVPGQQSAVFGVNNLKVALLICEDIWGENNPLQAEVERLKPDLIVVPNGSPFELGKESARRAAAKSFAGGTPLLYANLMGGQDELVFDGDSFHWNPVEGEFAEAKQTEGLVILSPAGSSTAPASDADSDSLEKTWDMLCMGLRDYCRKSGQDKVLLGLSGGIDSAVTAAIAVDAMGKDSVLGVSLPSRFSSRHSETDAEALARNLGIEFRRIPIDSAHRVIAESVTLQGTADENAQARIRALLLMAIANGEHRMLLSTGNKSEVAVGYSTIYGDAAGGFAPIKDVYKTSIWRLAEWRNRKANQDLIPRSSIEKEPSAELRPNQLDTDSLPDYHVLDQVLTGLIEENKTVSEIAAQGHDIALVRKVDSMVRAAEWKRSQGAIGTKVSSVAFGSGRRVPIATRFGEL